MRHRRLHAESRADRTMAPHQRRDLVDPAFDHLVKPRARKHVADLDRLIAQLVNGLQTLRDLLACLTGEINRRAFCGHEQVTERNVSLYDASVPHTSGITYRVNRGQHEAAHILVLHLVSDPLQTIGAHPGQVDHLERIGHPDDRCRTRCLRKCHVRVTHRSDPDDDGRVYNPGSADMQRPEDRFDSGLAGV